MKLIGSRTGGYEYWVKLKSGFKIWLGQRPNSDTDILLSKKEPKPIGVFDIFYGDPVAPYVENNRLIRPNGFEYLIFPICNKLFKRNMIDDLMLNYREIAEVEDAQNKKVGEIFLQYNISPMAICHQMDARAKTMKEKVSKAKPSA